MEDTREEAVRWPAVPEKKKKTYDTDVYVHVCSAPFLVYLDSTFSWHVAMWLLLGRPSSSFGCHGSLHNRMA